MAIYHYHAQVIGRKQGHSALAAAAYRAGVALADFDYSKRKASVDFAQIYAPENAPEWTQDRARLWQAVEDSEKRKDAQLCREINIALPVELTPAERQALVVEFVQSEFVSKGMIADLAIHHQNEANPHAHIMLTTRHIGPDGFGQKAREWNDRAVIQNTRKAWADIANVFLERAGHESRIDHRTLEAQGIDRPPQLHRGKTVTAMLRRGEQTRVTELESIRQEQATLAREENALAREFAELEKQDRYLEYEEKRERARKQSGEELADQIENKTMELRTARRERDLAKNDLENAIKKANAIANDIEEHNEEVSGQGFWGQLKNTFKNISNGRELNKTHRAAIQIATEAQTQFDEKQKTVAKLEADLATMKNEFAKTPLGQQRKREAELKAEQERQRAEQALKLAEQKKKEQEAERQKKMQERIAQREKNAPTISRGFGMGR